MNLLVSGQPLRRGAKINEKDSSGNTPIHYAASRDDTQMIEILIENKADVKVEGEDKQTPLHLAAKCDKDYIAEILIKNGAKINAIDKDGQTPLHLAIKDGNENTVKILIKNKADIDKKDDYGLNPLHYAILSGNTGMVKYLIYNGADINAVDERGRTPLYLANSEGYGEDMISFLLQNGADPLLENRDVEFLRYLVELTTNDVAKYLGKAKEVQQKEKQIDDKYESLKYSLLLSDNSSLTHIIKGEEFNDLISEWSADVSCLTEGQKKLNEEFLDVLKDLPNCDITRLENFLQDNENNDNLKFILNLQRGKSKLTALHVIPSVKDLMVGKDIYFAMPLAIF